MPKATVDETDELLEQLRSAVSYMTSFDVYQTKLEDAGIEPADIDSIETFRTLPTMDATDMARDIRDHPPYGSLLSDESDVVRVNHTPNPHLDGKMPVVQTASDLETNHGAETYRKLGVTADDVVLNTASMQPYPFGWSVAMAAEGVGATHVPTGPGDTTAQIDAIQRYDVSVVAGFPSFLLKIAREADETLDGVDLVIAGGEPFTAIDGYRERVRDAYGGDLVVTDGYGLSEVGSVARETPAEDGMHLFTDRLFPEVIDPDTGDLVERGEKGELVLTHLTETSVPVLRFRTHDLTILEERDGEYVLSEGVFGRTDRMRKVKGVKVYPDEIMMHLAGVDGIDQQNVQFRIERPTGGTHRFEITVGGDPDAVDESQLATEIAAEIGISLDGFEIVEDLEVDDEAEILEV